MRLTLQNPSGKVNTHMATVKSVNEAAAMLGRLGGLAKGGAKARTARENGRKGGRPKTKGLTKPKRLDKA